MIEATKIILTLLFSISLAAECFPPSLPSFVPSKDKDAEWYTVITNSASDTLFLGGQQLNKVTTELVKNELPFVAAYSIDSGTYTWAIEFEDSSQTTYYPKIVNALALSPDESGLVVAGKIRDHGDKYVFVYWLSSSTGAQMYDGLHIETNYAFSIWSSQMLTFGSQGYIYLLLDDDHHEGGDSQYTTLLIIELSGTSLQQKEQFKADKSRFTALVYNSITAAAS